MRTKATLLLIPVAIMGLIWAYSDRLALSRAGEYRQVGQPSRYLRVEKNGHTISNAFDAGVEKEYTWYVDSDDGEQLFYPRGVAAKPSGPSWSILCERNDWPFVYRHITISHDGVSYRFEKI